MNKGRVLNHFASCLCTLVIILILFKITKIAPFGERSLAIFDANIQYLDFFAYLKDVLLNKNNIGYSFGKTLGGNNIAVFSYYLSNPLNFLVLAFSKENLMVFFNLLVVLKISLAALTMSIFLSERFAEKGFNKYSVILATSYALCQYNIAQASNIMWLDGVYMLPLMMLGVYRIVNGRNGAFLIVTTAASISLNWYTGAINCLFSFIWLIYETTLVYLKNKAQFRSIIRVLIVYAVSMALGIGLSCVLLLPTLAALKSGNRGSLDFHLLKQMHFLGPLPAVMQSYTYGGESTRNILSFFSGNFVLFGVILTLNSIDRKIKYANALLLVMVCMICLWNPLFVVFSIFKSASSYWFRYSYLCSFVFIVVAAESILTKIQVSNAKCILKSILFLSFIIMILDYAKPLPNSKYVMPSLICFIIISTFYLYVQTHSAKRICTVALALLCLFDIGYNAKLLMKKYSNNEVDKFNKYSVALQGTIADIKRFDGATYRISNTTTRNIGKDDRITAYYNEALAYNYWSISGYTSSPDDIQRRLLDRMGYRINGENMCIVNTSILSADSLLGVKYVIDNLGIKGLKPISVKSENGTKVYQNPYSLPMAFKYKNHGKHTMNWNNNPFEYNNMLYSNLLGKDVSLFKVVPYEIINTNDNRFSIKMVVNGLCSVYGNIPWAKSFTTMVNVNNYYSIRYAGWLSQSVFYVPFEEHKEIFIDVNSGAGNFALPQFYSLDLERLREATNEIKKGAISNISISNGHAAFEVLADDNEVLFTSIPYDKGWRILLNNVEIKPELFADCLINIPLQRGKNIIRMDYEPPLVKVGMILSILSLFGLLLWNRYGCKWLLKNYNI